MTPLDTAAVPATSDTAEPDAENVITLGTRFGTFEIDLNKAVDMPQGPLGFTDLHRFAILDAPDSSDSPFKLFQALDDPGVTFVVTPLPTDSELIADEDLTAAATSYSIAPENAAFLLITKIQHGANGDPSVTVNLRAPIVVDVVHRVARQAVFSGDRYPMQYALHSGASGNA